MENASKALLIAGSILVVILLIAMGVRVLNSTSGTTDATEQAMQSTEVAMFNNKFLSYIGHNKSKSEILALLNTMISSNATSNKMVDVDRRYNPKGSNYSSSVSASINATSSMPSNSKFYAYIPTTDGYDQKGFICKITIELEK